MFGAPDDWNDSLNLFFSGEPGGSRACRLPSNIYDVGPLLHHVACMADGTLDPLYLPPIAEAVGCDVQNAHDPCALLPSPVWQILQGNEWLQILG